MTLPHQLDRTVTIQAPREIVFSFFTDSARWATWWGAGSTIDPKVGGRVYIRHPGNVEVSGDVVELQAPERIVFTYGYNAGTPIPPGSSRVTIRLEAIGPATRLHLTHEFSLTEVRDEHVQGWRYQLSLFANAVLNVVHADAAAKVDAWFRLWSEPDAARRGAALATIAHPTVVFRDRYSATEGAEDLLQQLIAVQKFMPGMTLQRRGDARHCQGMVLADWIAAGPDGAARGAGTNTFIFGADGRIASATGFWGS